MFSSTYCYEGTDLFSISGPIDIDLSSDSLLGDALGSVLSFSVSTTRDIETNGNWEKVVTAENEKVALI